MKNLLLLALLLTIAIPYQNPPGNTENSPMEVMSHKWTRSKRAVEKQDTTVSTSPQQAMIPANKNFARNARINDPAGVRDPNADTLDGRRDAIEKSVQESRRPQAKPQEGFLYKVKLQNSTPKVIEIVFWEYQFVDSGNANLTTRRQFLCGVSIGPEKNKELEGFSLSGPSDVVSVGALGNKPEQAMQERVVINRVEFADGSIWQRKDWNFHEVKLTYDRVLREPWVPGMCKPL
jgi:hypothetical protein